jgi:hypothetical protein
LLCGGKDPRKKAAAADVPYGRYTEPTNLLGTTLFFQCILMALRVLEKVQILAERLGLDFSSFFPE